MALSQYFYLAQLTPVRLVTTANVSATYSNGPANNGLGATLTVAAASLTIDSVATEVGDRILVANQTSTFQNGIYVVSSIGVTVVLTRSGDFQSIEQMVLGSFVTAIAGTVNAGRCFVFLVKPGAVGVDALTFTSVAAAVSGATVLNQIPVATDTLGTIGTSTGVAATLGGSLTTAGNVTAGASGTAGKFTSFPSTAATGSLIFEALANSGNTAVTVRNALHGQATVISIPDGGQTTTEFIIADSAGTQHITSGSLQIDAGSLYAGISGGAGVLRSYPSAATTGYLGLTGVANAADYAVVISNRSHGQATTYSIGDVGAATGSILVSAVAADPASNLIWFDVTVGQAALAVGGLVALVTSSGSKQYKVRELIQNDGGTDFSGGGGDRLGEVTDGTSIYTITPAASLQTLINARWGSTAVPFPVTIAANTSTVAGQNLRYRYNAGATDYTSGSVVISGMVQRVA